MSFRYLLLFAFLFPLAVASPSGLPVPAPDSALYDRRWPAAWITAPEAPHNDHAVILLRKTVTLSERPVRFVVHLSGDARYQLFVNGQRVLRGPQASAPPAWHYESIDLAPWLRAGSNVVAARVRSYGADGPLASMGQRLGFILQGDTPAERILDTNGTWKSWLDRGSQRTIDDRGRVRGYFAVAPAELFDGDRHPWDWATPGFADGAWPDASVLETAIPAGWGAENRFWLSPRSLPLLEEKPERLERVRRTKGVAVPAAFLQGGAPVHVPANTEAVILLDQGRLTNAYPQLTVSRGRGARVRLGYAEALIDREGQKGHRDEIEGRQLLGIADEFLPDGGLHRRFEPDDFRTYRYLQLTVTTAAEPLVVEDLHGRFTGYPFAARGSFTSDDPRLDRIWGVGWRTARLCALDTYVDCPYYEQLQYIGDTRIQALISLYVAGDDRLMRNAIELFDQSRLPEGITQSRYPSASAQLIPPFSLFWIDMVHDYWMHRDDPAFVSARLPGVHAVVDWFERHLDPNTGLLGPLPYWPYMDWISRELWPVDPRLNLGGVPPGGREGGSAALTLQFAYTLEHAGALQDAFGFHGTAVHYRQLATRLRRAVTSSCWNSERQLFADTPAQTQFSQHTNAFAVLSGTVRGNDARALLQRLLADRSLAQATTYFQFYLHEALRLTGLGNDYLAQLDSWHRMLDQGLTTFAEKEDPTRSDCHAWSASPLYGFLSTVCGVGPASPGFATVRIQPHLGPLQRAEGVTTHPRGEIVTKLRRQDSALEAEITLPAGVTGELIWNGRKHALKPGRQTLRAP